jgi:hypothetical protein
VNYLANGLTFGDRIKSDQAVLISLQYCISEHRFAEYWRQELHRVMHAFAAQIAFAHSVDWRRQSLGALAQLGERLICIQEVRSSILLGSTKLF